MSTYWRLDGSALIRMTVPLANWFLAAFLGFVTLVLLHVECQNTSTDPSTGRKGLPCGREKQRLTPCRVRERETREQHWARNKPEVTKMRVPGGLRFCFSWFRIKGMGYANRGRNLTASFRRSAFVLVDESVEMKLRYFCTWSKKLIRKNKHTKRKNKKADRQIREK